MKLAHLKLINNFIGYNNVNFPDDPDLEEARDALSKFIEHMDESLDEAIATTQKRADKMKARDVEIEDYV